jgi:hypothetical protein
MIVFILVAVWFASLALFVALRLHATKRRLEPLAPAATTRSRSIAALCASAPSQARYRRASS